MYDQENMNFLKKLQDQDSAFIDFQQDLRQNWKLKGVDECYTNLTLGYLKQIDLQSAKKQLLNEHEKIIDGRSYYQKIKELQQLRLETFRDLLQLCSQESDLQKACDTLDKLRKFNLKIFQAIFILKQQLQKRSLKSDLVIQSYMPYFNKINEDSKQIFHSYLKKFICFSAEFDPLLLHPYQKIQALSNKQGLPAPVLKLFTMNASYVYRLIKANNQLSSFRHFQNQSKIEKDFNTSEQNLQNISQKVKQARYRRYRATNLGQQKNNQIQKNNEERINAQSQPKYANRQQQQMAGETKIKTNKFKIRKSLQTKRSLSLHIKNEDLGQAEDEQINAFRKKMLARRERVKKIKSQSNKQEYIDSNQKNYKKNLSLNLSALCSDESRNCSTLNLSRSMMHEQYQNHHEQVSSQDQSQILQSKNIESVKAESISKIRKIRNNQYLIKKQQTVLRKDRVKLSPIPKYQPNYFKNSIQNSIIQSNNQESESQKPNTNPFQIQQVKQSSNSDSGNNSGQQSNKQKDKQTTNFNDLHLRKLHTLSKNKKIAQQKQKQKQKQKESQPSSRSTYRYKNKTQSDYPSSMPYRIAENNNILDQKYQNQQTKAENTKKQIRMKPDQIQLNDLFSFIQKQKINEKQRNQFQNGLWKQNIKLKHSYLTKFYMDKQLAAFGISSPRYDGDYSILYWGTNRTDKITMFLFQKYLDYLQKFTCLNNIYIGNEHYMNVGFKKSGSNFIRKRQNLQKKQLNFIPFLSLQCANICFQQKNDQETSFFYSQQIQEFNSISNKLHPNILLCKNELSNKFPQSAKFHEPTYSIGEINQILSSLEIDTFATDEKIQINNCKLFTLKDNCTIKTNYFYVHDGYFVPRGVQIYASEKSKIMKLQMQKQNYLLYFGKNFKTIQIFLSHCEQKSTLKTDCFFAFKMFSKQLYGKLNCHQNPLKGCYGNWDVNFLWQDQLKGTIIKDMPTSQYTFGPQKFYVAIYKEQNFILGFEAKPSDFFF